MAITKSAQKALRQSRGRREKNVKQKTKLKNLLKEVQSFISQKKIKEAKELLPQVYKEIDKAAKNHLLEKNTASRRKSKFARAIAKAQQ